MSYSSRRTSNPLRVKSTKNITNLHRHASKKGSVRVGATINPSQRANAYQRSGYRGNMYVTKTTNMNYAENKLLKSHSGRHNVQKSSNVAAKSGYVYAIVGQKRHK
eukprot:158336_1